MRQPRYLSNLELGKALKRQGFPDAELPTMIAIANAESGRNLFAHNPNASTGDNSYGPWQINMLGSMGEGRRRDFGLSSNEELFNLDTNARAAKIIKDNYGQGYQAWSVYRSGAYKPYLKEATEAARAIAGPNADLTLESSLNPVSSSSSLLDDLIKYDQYLEGKNVKAVEQNEKRFKAKLIAQLVQNQINASPVNALMGDNMMFGQLPKIPGVTDFSGLMPPDMPV